MDYKPSDLFVGVIDVFAILLPGALLAFALSDFAQHYIFGSVLPTIQGDIQGWVVFIFASYLLGHFIFLIGSFLDKPLYDRYRRAFLLKKGDDLYQFAKQIKNQHLNHAKNTEMTNAFKWSKVQLQLRYPHAMSELNRLEADSKFFRSLIVVLFILALILLYQTAWIALLFCIILILLSFFRYADQRFKSTELAYTYLLAMDHLTKAAASEATTIPNKQPNSTLEKS